MDLVSVIIPAYNAEKFVGEAIESVLVQTYPDIEVIVVNDGSSDGTEDVIRSFIAVDDRVRIVNQANRGCSGAKNAGLQQARGKYIQYLDADDLLGKDKIREQVEALASGDFEIAVCRTKVFSDGSVPENGIELDSEFLYTTKDGFGFLLNLYGLNGRDGMIQPNAFLISRELVQRIGLWDETISPSRDEDGEYFCRAMIFSNGIVFTEKSFNFYRKSDSSSSLSRQVSARHAAGGLLSLKKRTQHLLQVEDSERVRRIMGYHVALFRYQMGHLYGDVYSDARRFYQSLGLSAMPAVGGRMFRLFSGLVGFENALYVRKILKGY